MRKSKLAVVLTVYGLYLPPHHNITREENYHSFLINRRLSFLFACKTVYFMVHV